MPLYNDEYHIKAREISKDRYYNKGGKIKKALYYYKRKLNLTDEEIEGETLEDKLRFCMNVNFERKFRKIGLND